MANEGYFTLTLQASKNGAKVNDVDSSRFDMTGDDIADDEGPYA